jgi:hypothetical protein
MHAHEISGAIGQMRSRARLPLKSPGDNKENGSNLQQYVDDKDETYPSNLAMFWQKNLIF